MRSLRERWDPVDLTWLLIPAAIGLFGLRTAMIARRLKAAARTPSLADPRALIEAKASLSVHRDHLESALASPRAHLEAAKGLSRIPKAAVPHSRMDRMVEDFLPDRRL